MPDSNPNIRDHSGERLGPYRLLSRLAIGGMAEIYLARASEGPVPHVVLKLLRARFTHDPEFVRMFLDEGSLAARLEHPNIGRIYATGEERGFYYIAMEYLHGHDARAFLDHAIINRSRIPLEHVLTIVTGVAAGLHYAHEKRDETGRALEIVHRDVSPSNIFVTYDGTVKLVDFGLARAATQSSRFRAGLVQGKTAYMSPEQCRSAPLDRRSDIFSLGTVLYELTTGRRLFRNHPTDSNYEIMDRIVNGLIPRPVQVVPGYPADLQAIVMRALSVDPADRYATAQELFIDLEAASRGKGLSLSSAGLAGYIKSTFGHKPEPWQSLDSAARDQDYEPPGEDEFDDEVATSLYTGSLEDLQAGWGVTPEPPARAPTEPPEAGRPTRPSMSRLALPLQAEDSDVFESPLLAKLAQEPLPGELAERLGEVQAEQAGDDQDSVPRGDESRDDDDRDDDVEVIEISPQSEQILQPERVSLPDGRAATHPGVIAGAQQSIDPHQPGARAPTVTESFLLDQRSTRWWLVILSFLLIAGVLAATLYFLGFSTADLR